MDQEACAIPNGCSGPLPCVSVSSVAEWGEGWVCPPAPISLSYQPGGVESSSLKSLRAEEREKDEGSSQHHNVIVWVQNMSRSLGHAATSRSSSPARRSTCRAPAGALRLGLEVHGEGLLAGGRLPGGGDGRVPCTRIVDGNAEEVELGAVRYGLRSRSVPTSGTPHTHRDPGRGCWTGHRRGSPLRSKVRFADHQHEARNRKCHSRDGSVLEAERRYLEPGLDVKIVSNWPLGRSMGQHGDVTAISIPIHIATVMLRVLFAWSDVTAMTIASLATTSLCAALRGGCSGGPVPVAGAHPFSNGRNA
ncbi:hypothetical protein CSUB01_08782 [Colletotrichum sublineola]|uniref:Uncharacterized protein n=1 Tax=Colletotrichum sublineola TaxID=1173701 RepID=A0A066XDR5_COLSU|nr:hypothetical protein CSUB01_08782 [Colletotrichum sublineola]